jgi:hypothetical protein
MKSAFIVLSSFLLFAAVHGSALLETRANDQGKDQGKGSGSPNGQGGNGTFVIPSSCTNGASRKPHSCTFETHALIVAIPTAQGTGVPVTPPTNQTSNGAPPPQCFNLTASDPTSGDQPSFVVQFNNSSSSAQGNPPPSNQTSSNGDNNGSSADPQCVTFSFSLFRLSPRILNNARSQLPILPEHGWHLDATIRERDNHSIPRSTVPEQRRSDQRSSPGQRDRSKQLNSPGWDEWDRS